MIVCGLEASGSVADSCEGGNVILVSCGQFFD
jgi:hypothetical protein